MPAFVIASLHPVTSEVVSKAPCGYKTHELAALFLGPGDVTGPGGCKYGIIFDKDATLLNCEQDLNKNLLWSQPQRRTLVGKPVSQQL